MNISKGYCVIKNFPLSVERNCLLASIKDLMEYYGISIKESELYFICKAFRFNGKNTNEDYANLSDFFSYDKYSFIIKNISELFNCKFCFHEIMERNKIIQYLSEGIPMTIIIPPGVISYNYRIFQPVGRQEMHCINIFGYSNNKRVYYVADATVTDDKGEFTCIKSELDYDIVETYSQGYFLFHTNPDKNNEPNLVKDCIISTFSDFLSEKDNVLELNGLQAVKKIITCSRFNKEHFKREIKFLIQAYFMPVFFYLDECLSEFENMDDMRNLVKVEKNKWDIFYYKYLLNYKSNYSKDTLMDNYNLRLSSFSALLQSVCNNILLI